MVLSINQTKDDLIEILIPQGSLQVNIRGTTKHRIYDMILENLLYPPIYCSRSIWLPSSRLVCD